MDMQVLRYVFPETRVKHQFDVGLNNKKYCIVHTLHIQEAHILYDELRNTFRDVTLSFHTWQWYVYNGISNDISEHLATSILLYDDMSIHMLTF